VTQKKRLTSNYSSMKKALCSMVVVGFGSGLLVSCGYNSNSSNKAAPSGYNFRAFVSNPLHVSQTGAVIPVLEIIDAAEDTGPFFNINLQAASNFPGMMALSPSRQFTAVYSTTDFTVATVNNASEALATSAASSGSTSTASLGAITLPGPAVNMVFWSDNNTVFVPVPTATSVYNPTAEGDVEVLNLTQAAITSTIPVPGAQYEALSADGNNLLVFGNAHDPTTNTDEVAVIAPFLIGTNTSPVSFVTGFDKPVGAVFNGSTAYVLDCGLECGGVGPASIVPLALGVGSTAGGTPVPLSAGGVSGGATVGLISGTTLYVAGTPPGTACPAGTAATSCGVLSVVDLNSMTVTATATITDGYHDHMQMGENGQLFIGSHACTNINSSTETRGCLSIVNAGTPSAVSNSGVVIPPYTGDVTGLQPVTGRNVVYVCQGGSFRIYDTTTDKLLVQTVLVDIVGQPTDVLLVDGPQ
jgi:hypothetical protein